MYDNGSSGTTRIHDATQRPAGQGYVLMHEHYPANISEASRYEFEDLMSSMGFRTNCPRDIRPERRAAS